MSANNAKSNDYQSLASSSRRDGAESGDISTLRPSNKQSNEIFTPEIYDAATSLVNPLQPIAPKKAENELSPSLRKEVSTEPGQNQVETPKVKEPKVPLSFAEEQKQKKLNKAVEKDKKLLSSDPWLARNGHTMTYAGLFMFTLMVYYRPYEWIPGFEGFTSAAFIFALATLLIYLPTQLSTEGSISIMTTEVKCLLFLVLWGIMTMPIAKDPSLSWKIFSETYSKIVVIFIVMVNTIRTKERLKAMMWLSIGIGVILSYQAIEFYREGKFNVEGYRVNVDFGGMFGNPNDMALHLVMFTPLAFILGIASKNYISKVVYFIFTALMIGANMVTQSRGGFLGLVAVGGFLIWKLSKKNRLQVIAISIVLCIGGIAVAPGDYGKRIISIFDTSQDVSGSHNQRQQLLERSIIVTLRNPLGIGLGNFPIVGINSLQSHNAFTQISSELGWICLFVYLAFMISPFRKLAAMERQMYARSDTSWIYYLSIGLQSCIVGYMVSSFFVSVAYQWFIYYPIAYAVCLRRIYHIQQEERGEPIVDESSLKNYFKLQKV